MYVKKLVFWFPNKLVKNAFLLKKALFILLYLKMNDSLYFYYRSSYFGDFINEKKKCKEKVGYCGILWILWKG